MFNVALLAKKKDDLASLNDSFFMDLASDSRRSMLLKLNEGNARLSQLAKDLGMSIQETYRNATRLIDSGLIEKNPENSLSITPYGRMMMNQIPSFQFILNNKEYFQEHTTGDLPTKFIQRMGALSNCEQIHGIGPVLEKMKMTCCLETKEYLKIIISQYPMEVAKLTIDRAKQGIKFSYIFGENTIIPKGRSELLKKVSWEKLISEGIVQRRMLKTVQVSLIMNENQACLFFPNLKGETDMVDAFYSQDKLFHEWCLDFYNYQWDRAGSFKNSKLKEL